MVSKKKKKFYPQIQGVTRMMVVKEARYVDVGDLRHPKVLKNRI